MATTRRRITQAAVELHGTVGPGATTMSAVAKRAGVTRATLYRHFPDEQALFAACSREWLSANPWPDFARWAAIADPAERVRTALGEMYAYYRATEAMLGNLYRDIASLPAGIAANLASYPEQMLRVLDQGWRAPSVGRLRRPESPAPLRRPGSAARLRRAAILHAVAFETWRSLARGGLSDAEAARLMAGLVEAASSGADPS